MIEKTGVPTVTFCTTSFRPLVTTRRSSLGLPDLPAIFLPHPIMNKTPQQVDALIEGVFQEVVDYLTGEHADLKKAGGKA